MLAVIIPYYKLTFFEETLKSLENQTNKNFKVYIGDDASPDNPAGLLEEYKGKINLVYHRFNENLGAVTLTKQWERCIELAKDETWLMILGDDDVLSENVVEEFYSHLSEFENSTNLVRFASKTISQETQKISEKFVHPKKETAFDFYYRRYKGLTRSSLSEYIFSKEIYIKKGFREYPLGWHSDDMAWIDFSGDNFIYTINNSWVIIRISEINITGKKDNFLLKHKAEELFYRDLVTEKLDFFRPFKRNELLMSYEIAIKRNRKLTRLEWNFLLKNYSKNHQILPLLKCIRRFFRDFVIS